MIVPMLKYTFLVFHKEYDGFLQEIQKLGVLHVVEKEVDFTEELQEKYTKVNSYEKAIQLLTRRNIEPKIQANETSDENLPKIILQIDAEISALETKLEELKNAYDKALPWGNFSPELIEKLNKENIRLRFFITNSKRFKELVEAGLPVIQVSEPGSQTRFVLVEMKEDQFEPDAEPASLPPVPVSDLKVQIEEAKNKIALLNQRLNEYAAGSIPLLEDQKSALRQKCR